MSTLDFFEPRRSSATASGLLRRLVLSFSGLAKRRRAGKAQRMSRDAFETMRGLDDRILRDIGLTRSDVEFGMSLPLHEDAASILRQQKGLR